MRPLEGAHDRNSGGLVAVDAPDDGDARPFAGDVDERDRPVLHRVADDKGGR
jgi:hypothetical protein